MANISLSALRLKCRQRSDQENSQLITDIELNGLINDSIKELYDKLLSTYGDEYYSKSYDFNLSSGTKSYSLPSDFYKLISANLIVQDREFPLRKLDFTEIARSSPQNSGVIRMHYVPFFTDLVNDIDEFDEFNGWGEYVVLDVAMKMMEKEETDTSQLVGRFAKMDERLKRMAKSRDLGQSHKIIDVRSNLMSRYCSNTGYYLRASDILIVNTSDDVEGYLV